MKYKKLIFVFLIIGLIVLFTACGQEKKINADNYYEDILAYNNDCDFNNTISIIGEKNEKDNTYKNNICLYYIEVYKLIGEETA